MWLMVQQRLQAGASLGTAVLQLLRGIPASFWPRPCKRILQWREHGKAPSSHTAAYNQARQALPLSIVQRSSDHIFQQLVSQMDDIRTGASARAFILDGTSMRMAHSPASCELYPPGSNQHGDAHWPLIRMLVAHDVSTGLAMPPEWGAMNGPDAVSEQLLLERAIDRLPKGSVLIGDANFGVFSVAYSAVQREHPMVLRLTLDRARRLAGEAPRDGIDRELDWKPSRADRKSHPHLPADACVKGHLLVKQVQPNVGGAPLLLAFFTTVASSQESLELYAKRWAIETDLRTLKSTLHLGQLTSSTPDMVAKEIEMGIVAYNLIRAFIGLASRESGIPTRGYSFTKVRQIVEILGPDLASAPDPVSAKRIFHLMMRCVQQSKLPKRTRKRPSYPREVWKRGATFPSPKR